MLEESPKREVEKRIQYDVSMYTRITSHARLNDIPFLSIYTSILCLGNANPIAILPERSFVFSIVDFVYDFDTQAGDPL
jgi:hypothetical protein